MIKTAVIADIFKTSPLRFDAICITTNGTIKKDGTCVMGRGIALRAKQLYPGIDKTLGRLIMDNGNKCFLLKQKTMDSNPWIIYSLPTKHQYFQKSDIDFILINLSYLRNITEEDKVRNIAIPLPGCGNGGLNWKNDVLPRLEVINKIHEPTLNRFTFVTNNKTNLEK